jgi:hypothetical protein
MKIEEIIKQPEGRRLEFKEAIPLSYKETHYERLQNNANDYERLRTIMNEYEQIYQNPSKPDFNKQELQQESLFTLVISKLLDAPKSRKEISNELGQKSISGRLNEVLAKLLQYRLIEWTIKDKPNSPKQKFTLTKRGLAFYVLVRNK